MKHLVLLLVLCLSACTGKQPTSPFQSQVCHHIPFDSITQEWPAPTDIECIPLETNDSTLIGNINKVIFRNNLFHIFDPSEKKVLMFDRQGEFVKQIHKVGMGPGEYTTPYDMDVDDQGNVYLSDLDNQHILIYKNGNENECETIRMAEPFLEFAVKGDVIFLGNVYRNEAPAINLAAYNRATGELTTLKENQLPEGNTLPMASHYFFRSGEEILYIERFRPTVYQLQADGTASTAIQMETSQAPTQKEIAEWAAANPMEQMQKHFQYYSDLTSCHENSSYIFATATNRKVLFHKESKRSYCTKGLPKTMKFLGRPLCSICDDKFVSFLNPADSKFQELLSVVTDQQRELLQSLSEEENPVLILFGFE